MMSPRVLSVREMTSAAVGMLFPMAEARLDLNTQAAFCKQIRNGNQLPIDARRGSVESVLLRHAVKTVTWPGYALCRREKKKCVPSSCYYVQSG